MTVLPFRARASASETPAEPQLATVADVKGSFSSPSGRAGTFTGCYRLERFVARSGAMAAAGVFTGELTDADGSRIGVGSRRQTAAIDVVANGPSLVVRLGPLDVNLLGFLVSMRTVSMEVRAPFGPPADREALRLVDSGVPTTEEPPLSVTELLSTVLSAVTAKVNGHAHTHGGEG